VRHPAGADLLWRAKSNIKLPVGEVFDDGSYLSYLVEPDTHRKGRRVPVRVIEYTIGHDKDPCGQVPETPGKTYRLVTTIHDPAQAPADELAALYARRWEVETLFDEIKIHQQDARLVLRSRDPKRVEQEVWGVLLLHRALRTLIHSAARTQGLDPDRVSFTHAVKVVRRHIVRRAIFPPHPNDSNTSPHNR
jgi:hypothetical protein